MSKLLTAAVVVPLFVLLVSSVLRCCLHWSSRCASTTRSRRCADGLGGPVWIKLQASFMLMITTSILWYLPLIAY